MENQIRMFFRDIEKHHVPHIHAEYQGEVAVYSIHDGTLLAGSIPSKKHKLVVAWIEIHQEDLLADWELAVHGKQPFRIRGLDQCGTMAMDHIRSGIERSRSASSGDIRSQI